jgi:hypothetical protein
MQGSGDAGDLANRDHALAAETGDPNFKTFHILYSPQKESLKFHDALNA